jgi:hypothetical protein
MEVTILEWTPQRHAKLIGFADVQIGYLVINGVTVLIGYNGMVWAKLPERPTLNPDNTVRRDPDGKILKSPCVRWRSRDASDAFSRAVETALRQYAPDDMP